jgi:hypothetical protein
MKKTILLLAITSLIYSCTPSAKEETTSKADSLALPIDTLPVVCDTACADTSCADTTIKK